MIKIKSQALSSRHLIVIVSLILLLSSQLCYADWHSREEPIMGTRVFVKLWEHDKDLANQATQAVIDVMNQIDADMSPFKYESEISRVNREASDQPVKVSKNMLGLLEYAIGISQLTNGAFDVTFASVGFAYRYRDGVLPDQSWVEKQLPKINYRNILINAEKSTVFFLAEGIKIDFGGIAKGYAVDRSIDVLKAMGISQAIVTAGGDTRIIGDHTGRPWNIAIKDPRRASQPAAILPLTDTALSTSGDYERYFILNGERHHHIINPKTGRSSKGVRSVSILASNATMTDALSTSVFVLGVDKGMALIENLNNVEAIMIDDQGQLKYSSGLLHLSQSAD